MYGRALFANPMKQIHEELLFFIEWKNKFTQAGCQPLLISNLFRTNIIEDYNKLYKHFLRLLPSMRKEVMHRWELLCLSGEPGAFEYATKFCNLTAKTYNRSGKNPLHYATLSGNPHQFNKAFKINIDWQNESLDHYNILHFAILSNNPTQLTTVLTLESESGKLLPRLGHKNRNPLHLAAFTGSLEMIQLCAELVDDIFLKDDLGFNALDYARANKAKQAIKLLSSLGLRSNRNDFWTHIQ